MTNIARLGFNGLLVVTCVLTCINIGNSWFSGSIPVRGSLAIPPAGTKLDVPEQDWARSSATVVLAVSPRCHVCEDGVPFYKTLVTSANAAGVGLVALTPDPEEATRQWLSNSGLPNLEVRRFGSTSNVFNYLPTITLADTHGMVERSWAGRLATAQQKEVIALISRARNSVRVERHWFRFNKPLDEF